MLTLATFSPFSRRIWFFCVWIPVGLPYVSGTERHTVLPTFHILLVAFAFLVFFLRGCFGLYTSLLTDPGPGAPWKAKTLWWFWAGVITTSVMTVMTVVIMALVRVASG